MLNCLQTIQGAKANPSVLKVCSSEKLLDQFNECNKLLDSVQKVTGAAMLSWQASCSGLSTA